MGHYSVAVQECADFYCILCVLYVSLCTYFWQHVLGAHGALTASTHVTVAMELSAALQMESVSAALDGQDSTALSVCFCLSHTHRQFIYTYRPSKTLWLL